MAPGSVRPVTAAPPPTRPSAWNVVLAFGLVSLFADMVYEGARSLYGPALLALGASGALVGAITGAGEAMALVLRLVAGPAADRRGAHWSFTVAGYGLTAVCVPLLALSPRLGVVGLAFGATMILLERAGKAVRSPSKSALLATAARAVGRGRGFGVHKALDQVGAFAGPLLVAAVVAATSSLWVGFAALVVPGAVAIIVLLLLRHALREPEKLDAPGSTTDTPGDTATSASPVTGAGVTAATGAGATTGTGATAAASSTAASSATAGSRGEGARGWGRISRPRSTGTPSRRG